MEITQTTATQGATQEVQARQSLSSDLDTFLKLLTAQIENQDPLEPADGTEYAAQLAQFSSVEQSVRTNELLSEMTSAFARQDLAVAADWIGMDVRHTGPLAISGEGVPITLDISTAADRAELVVTNTAGDEVLRRPVDPSTDALDWAGGDGLGNVLPDGIYQLSVAAYAGDQDLGVRPVSHYARVDEVTLGPEGATLLLTGGVAISIEELSALRTGDL